MILTYDLIEKAARAMFEAWPFEYPGKGSWTDLPEGEKQSIRATARACLEAILPDVVEKCAKAAEGSDPNALLYRWVLARDIRSLLNKENE